jgi:hypothetical protein
LKPTNLIDSRNREPQFEDFLEVSYTKATNTDTFQFPLLVCIANRAPAFFPRIGTTQRTVDEIQVNVAEPALVKGELDGFEGLVVAGIDLQLGRVKNSGARRPRSLAEVQNRLAALFFILVPRRRVLGRVRRANRPDLSKLTMCRYPACHRGCSDRRKKI